MSDFDIELVQTTVRALSGTHSTLPARALAEAARISTSRAVTIDLAATGRLGFPVVVVHDVPAVPPAFMARLTEREGQVAHLLARGCTNKQIARELGISVATAKDHVHAILAKSGLSNRVAIALALAAAGM